jgi:hypothetical protein
MFRIIRDPILYKFTFVIFHVLHFFDGVGAALFIRLCNRFIIKHILVVKYINTLLQSCVMTVNSRQGKSYQPV